jgi:hypothetical protein
VPEHLRALVVILALSIPVFALAKAPITATISSAEDFRRRRNLWFFFTFAAFFAHSFWLFALLLTCALVLARRNETNPMALYLALFIALPPISQSIPGLGLVNELFAVDHVRLLALFVLLPAYMALRRQPGTEAFGRLLPDKLLLGYLVLEVALTLPYRTLTSVLRDSVAYAFTDVFLPYYVASRSVRTLKAFRDALGALVVSVLVLSLILLFEYRGYWLLYSALDRALGVDWGGNSYLTRAGNLRASGTIGHAIAAGYVCAAALGLYLYLRTVISSVFMRRLAMLVIAGGLLGALSRAPWLGAVAMIVVFMALGPSPVASLSKLGLAVVATLPVLLATDIGSKIIDYLPWVGEVDARNVDGRARLAEVAFQVFLENPVFGRFDYLVHPAMEALRGSDGIIDTVNTYVVVGLRGGGVGLALFVGVFTTAGYGVFKSLRRLGNKGDERHALGRALLATLIGVLLIIGTVSPILVIPTVYWILAGLAVGYSRMIALDTASARVPADGRNREAVRRFAATGAVRERPGVRRL